MMLNSFLSFQERSPPYFFSQAYKGKKRLIENQNNWIHEMEFNFEFLVCWSRICRLWEKKKLNLRIEPFLKKKKSKNKLVAST